MRHSTNHPLREPFPTSGQGRVLAKLRAAAEGHEAGGWRMVHLDGGRPADMTAHQFVGFLALLKNQRLLSADRWPGMGIG
jgi:hypothetical protein